MTSQKVRSGLFFLLLSLAMSPCLLAQQPSWTDYYKRAEMYPESTWLTGFVSGVNTLDENPGKLIDVYESMARDKVVQSIEVEIETQNDLTISNINGKSDEAFLSKSVSFSNAKINGLRTEHFYDKKKKQVYAFSYVNKKELAFYYKNLMAANQQKLEQKLKEGRSFLKMGNKEDALRSFYEGMPLLTEIDQAHMLLVALNRKMLAEIHLDEINGLRLDIQQEINDLQKGSELNMEEAAYFVAYGLFVQLGEITQPVSLRKTTYLNTGFSSQFSDLWNDALKEALVKAGNYQVKNSGSSAMLEVFGNYWVRNNEVHIHNQVVKNGEIVAVSNGHIPLSWLTAQHIVYLPEELARIELIDKFNLEAINPDLFIKAGIKSDIPLQTKVTVNGEVAPNIPIQLIDKQSKEVISTAISNNMGMADGYVPALDYTNPLMEVEALVSIADYVPMDTLTAYYSIVKKQTRVIPAHFLLRISKQVYCIQSNERLSGSLMEIKTIEPIIKQALVDEGYQFTDNPEEADFIINIEADATTGTSHQGIYFTYVDANLSIVNQVDNKEIFKTHVDQVKGGGANYAKAGKKAYLNAATQLKEALLLK